MHLARDQSQLLKESYSPCPQMEEIEGQTVRLGSVWETGWSVCRAGGSKLKRVQDDCDQEK